MLLIEEAEKEKAKAVKAAVAKLPATRAAEEKLAAARAAEKAALQSLMEEKRTSEEAARQMWEHRRELRRARECARPIVHVAWSPSRPATGSTGARFSGETCHGAVPDAMIG